MATDFRRCFDDDGSIVQGKTQAVVSKKVRFLNDGAFLLSRGVVSSINLKDLSTESVHIEMQEPFLLKLNGLVVVNFKLLNRGYFMAKARTQSISGSEIKLSWIELSEKQREALSIKQQKA